MAHATIHPFSRALKGARVPSAITWYPLTLPTASHGVFGHDGSGVRAVLPSWRAVAPPATPVPATSTHRLPSAATRSFLLPAMSSVKHPHRERVSLQEGLLA